jgi:hypothetical protein
MLVAKMDGSAHDDDTYHSLEPTPISQRRSAVAVDVTNPAWLTSWSVNCKMRILLHNMTREPEAGRVRMSVQFGDEPVKSYFGDYEGSDPKFVWSNVAQELFMRLSDLAVKRYCNCAIYQIELMGIIGAFVSSKSIPAFPIELGTTSFGMSRPSNTKIFCDRVRRPFYRAWGWWKYRHIRRENLLKYGKAPNGKA